MVRESMTKTIVVYCHGSKKIVFCDTTFGLNKSTTYESPYMVNTNCLWSVGCQIVLVLTGSSAKLKRGHMKHNTLLRKAFRGPRGHGFAWGFAFIEFGLASALKTTTAWKCRKSGLQGCKKNRIYPTLAKIQI